MSIFHNDSPCGSCGSGYSCACRADASEADALAYVAGRALARAEARKAAMAFEAATTTCPVCRGTGEGPDVFTDCGACSALGRVSLIEAAEIRGAA